MKFLIKAIFWLGVVVFFLPVPESERSKDTAHVSTVDAIAFLSTAYSDIKGFCTRNPNACITGSVAMQHFGEKAQYGSKILHEFISTKMAETKDLKPPQGSLAKANVNQQKQAPGNHGTLSATDLAPAYHAPKSTSSQS